MLTFEQVKYYISIYEKVFLFQMCEHLLCTVLYGVFWYNNERRNIPIDAEGYWNLWM